MTLITTSASRLVRSFSQFLEDCYAACSERSTRVLDAANQEWDHGKKKTMNVQRKIFNAKNNSELS